jgi:hypothetical protein
MQQFPLLLCVMVLGTSYVLFSEEDANHKYKNDQ